MKILLHDHVAATGEGDILIAYQRGADRRLSVRVFRPVDETHQIPVVKVTEAMHLIHWRSRAGQPLHDLHCELEA